jgi:hypothetical protein
MRSAHSIDLSGSYKRLAEKKSVNVTDTLAMATAHDLMPFN